MSSFSSRIPSSTPCYLHSFAILLRFLLTLGSFSDLPCSWWPWQFGGVLGRQFIECLSDGNFLTFSFWLDWSSSREDHRGKMPFSLHHTKGTYYQLGLSMLFFILITWLKECLSGFSTVKLLFLPPPFSFCPLWKEVTMYSPPWRSWGLCSSSRFYIHYLEFSAGDLPMIAYLFMCSIIYLYQNRLVDIYVILWDIIQYFLILLLNLFQISPLETLSVSWLCVRLMYLHLPFVLFRTSLLSVPQNAPGSFCIFPAPVLESNISLRRMLGPSFNLCKCVSGWKLG